MVVLFLVVLYPAVLCLLALHLVVLYLVVQYPVVLYLVECISLVLYLVQRIWYLVSGVLLWKSSAEVVLHVAMLFEALAALFLTTACNACAAIVVCVVVSLLLLYSLCL